MLSEDRASHWVAIIVRTLLERGFITCGDRDQAIRAALRAMRRFVGEHQQMEVRVRQKIGSLKREVQEGSREWDVLYARYYEEELSRSHLK